MSIRQVLSEGGRQVLRFRKLMVFFYAANLLAALVVAVPAAALIASRLSRSLESDRLFASFDPSWISETVLLYRGAVFSAAGLMTLAVAVLFLVLNVFLAGGALAVFHREDDTFFGACSRFFPRMFRILLLALIAYGIVSFINSSIAGGIDQIKKTSMQAWPFTVLHWIRLLITGLLLGTVNMIFDYAKIVCVAENRRSAFRSVAAAIRFTFSNACPAFAIYWICSGVGLLFLLAYHGASELIGQASMPAVTLLFLVRQACMLCRMWVRLWTWSSEMGFYVAGLPAVAPEPPPVVITEGPLEPLEVL